MPKGNTFINLFSSVFLASFFFWFVFFVFKLQQFLFYFLVVCTFYQMVSFNIIFFLPSNSAFCRVSVVIQERKTFTIVKTPC